MAAIDPIRATTALRKDAHRPTIATRFRVLWTVRGWGVVPGYLTSPKRQWADIRLSSLDIGVNGWMVGAKFQTLDRVGRAMSPGAARLRWIAVLSALLPLSL